MATLSYNETQGALKAKMETYGEGHVFQYATDGLELHTLCSQQFLQLAWETTILLVISNESFALSFLWQVSLFSQ